MQPTGPDQHQVHAVEHVTALIDALPRPAGATLGLGLADDLTVSPPILRVVMAMVSLGIDAAGEDGRTHLFADTQRDWLLTIAGPAAVWPVGLLAMTVDEVAAQCGLSDTRMASGARTCLLARGIGARLSLLLPAGLVQPGRPPPLILKVPPPSH